jgi:hypothetical protein
MAAGVLGWRNRLEEGALSAGSEIPAAPVTNVIVQQGAEPWVTAYGVTTSAAGAKLQCDAGVAVTWRAFCLARTNLSIGATVRWRLGTTAGAGNVMDSTALGGVVAGVNQHVYVAPAELSARYLTVDIEDAANPDGQIIVGLAFAGPVLQPRIDFDWPSTEGRQHRTDRAQSDGGQVFSRPKWQQRVWSLQWNGLDDSEVAGGLKQADQYGRAGGSVLFVPGTGWNPMQDAVLGELTDPSPFSWPQPGASYRRAWRATIVERL